MFIRSSVRQTCDLRSGQAAVQQRKQVVNRATQKYEHCSHVEASTLAWLNMRLNMM